MIEYSLLDKLVAVYNLVMESPLFLIILSGIILMIIDLTYISNKDSKTKKIYLVVSLVVLALFMYNYIESIGTIFDSIAKNIVELIYFPSVLEYITTLVVSLIILTISIFSKKMNKVVKKVNIVVFIINTFLFLLILDQFAGMQIDPTNKASIYLNTNMMMLLELSLIIFASWIVGLILYKIIRVLTGKGENTEAVNLTTDDSAYKHFIKRKTITIPKFKKETKIDNFFTLEEYQEMKNLLEVIRNSKK